jgi:hypothetical protein
MEDVSLKLLLGTPAAWPDHSTAVVSFNESESCNATLVIGADAGGLFAGLGVGVGAVPAGGDGTWGVVDGPLGAVETGVGVGGGNEYVPGARSACTVFANATKANNSICAASASL